MIRNHNKNETVVQGFHSFRMVSWTLILHEKSFQNRNKLPSCVNYKLAELGMVVLCPHRMEKLFYLEIDHRMSNDLWPAKLNDS